jgi:hypothetical protein
MKKKSDASPSTVRDEERKVEDSRTFQLFMQRFDTLEDLHATGQELLKEHAALDAKVHAIVVQHSMYWSIMKWALSTALPGGGILALWTYWKS